MLKITLFNPKGIPGCVINSHIGEIYLIKGYYLVCTTLCKNLDTLNSPMKDHYYLTCTILCKNLDTLNSFIEDCDQKTNAQTEIRKIKKVKSIFYRKYFYYSKEK